MLLRMSCKTVWFERGVKEAIYIRALNPNVNRDEGKYNLQLVWDNIIKKKVKAANLGGGGEELCKKIIFFASWYAISIRQRSLQGKSYNFISSSQTSFPSNSSDLDIVRDRPTKEFRENKYYRLCVIGHGKNWTSTSCVVHEVYLLSRSGSREFEPRSGRTWSAWYFCPKSYSNQTNFGSKSIFWQSIKFG